MSYNLADLGLKIKQERRRQGISQEKLAEMVSMDVKSIIRTENAKSSPSIDTVIKIANVLNIKIADLFEKQEHPSRDEIIDDINKCISSMNDDALNKFYKSVYYYIR